VEKKKRGGRAFDLNFGEAILGGSVRSIWFDRKRGDDLGNSISHTAKGPKGGKGGMPNKGDE